MNCSTVRFPTHARTPTYLVVLGYKLVEALLDNVVPVQVLDERHNMHSERIDDGRDLYRLTLVYNMPRQGDVGEVPGAGSTESRSSSALRAFHAC